MKLDSCREHEKRPRTESKQRAVDSNHFKPSKKKGVAEKQPKEVVLENVTKTAQQLEELIQPVNIYSDPKIENEVISDMSGDNSLQVVKN